MHGDEGVLDPYNKIVPKIINDSIWLSPDWFLKHFGKYNYEDLFNIKDLDGIDGFVEMPSIFTVYGAKYLQDKEIYPRLLGATSLVCFNYLHPIGNLIKLHGTEGRFFSIFNKFNIELAENINLLPVQRVDFDHFSYEQLKENCISSQIRCFEIGNELYSIYTNGTSFVQKPSIIVELYGNIVNLNLYCWLMTTNQEALSYHDVDKEKIPDIKLKIKEKD